MKDRECTTCGHEALTYNGQSTFEGHCLLCLKTEHMLRKLVFSAACAMVIPLSLSFIALPFWRDDLVLPTLYPCLGYGLMALACSLKLIPILGPVFKARGLKGRDRLKPYQRELYVIC